MFRICFVIVCALVLFASNAQAAYVVIDAETGRVLEGVQEHERRPIASLTKIWTALLVVENSDIKERVRISQQATLQEGSSIYIKQDEVMTIEQLLYGLLLRSGNDAAYALAEAVGGSEQGFVYLMNERAATAGLARTNFMNASGLHGDTHLSSAYDVARMLQIALEHNELAPILKARRYEQWSNKHRLLHDNIGALAGKTGYTKVAGRTLATYFERDDKRFIVVTLNEPNDWLFHKAAADRIDAHYEMKTVIPKGTYSTANRTVKIKKPIQLLLTDEESRRIRHVWQIRRTDEQILWHLFLDNTRIYSERMK